MGFIERAGCSLTCFTSPADPTWTIRVKCFCGRLLVVSIIDRHGVLDCSTVKYSLE